MKVQKIRFAACSQFLFLFLFAQSFADINESSALKTYKERLRVIENSLNPAEMYEATKDLVPTNESFEILKQTLAHLPDRHNNGDFEKAFNPENTIMILLEAFEKHASSVDIELLADLNRWADLSHLEEVVQQKIIQTAIYLKNISSARKLVSMNTLYPSSGIRPSPTTLRLAGPSPQKISDAHQSALIEIERFYRSMKDRVVGQDDILKSFRSLYISDLISGGRRIEPEVFYLMGLPGNGKDTIAEAYIDALWNMRDAHVSHMYRINIRTKEEAWSLFGSSKGYVGSADLPSFLKFLVEHSGGKYILGSEATPQGTRTIVEKNTTWKADEFTLRAPSHKAVIFVNEAHNIPRAVKDNILKQAIERGIFPITNPGSTPNAVSQIQLPVTFIFASNEGIDLLEPREKNGARLGKPLSFDRLLENYERVFKDKERLKQAIMKGNGELNNPNHPDQPGTSEEFLNRFPDHRVHLLRPLSPENLQRIAEILIKAESNKLKNASGRLGQYTVTLSEEAIRFITQYDSIPSENSRPIKARLKSFVFDEIFQAIESKEIKPSSLVQDIYVDIQLNPDGSRSAHFKITDSNPTSYEFWSVIDQTLKDVPQEPLSRDRIEAILKMRQQILDNVFGVEHIVDKLIEAAIVSESESRNAGESKRPATVMAFLGKTSTGKTETAKQYVKARYGTHERLETIDFNGIRDLQAMNARILGTFDARNNPIASDFMKAYDRAPDGNIAFIFDEAANSPRELLKGLYEILREPVVSGFSDGKPRPMKNVTIILTGNAGEQIYNLIPKDLPTDVYERAMREVFRIFLNNADLQQRILAETFPDAFIARLGNNVYHFGPLKDSGKRQVAQLKLLKGLEGLKPKNSERGWNMVFAKESDILDLFDLIEKEGFNSAHQGASIDSFVRLSIIDKIKAKLLSENVANGQDVMIEVAKESIVRSDRDVSNSFRHMKIITEAGQEFIVEIPISKRTTSMAVSDVDRILTAYHEVGHEIVSEVYFGDRVRPKYISIIEGVTLIGASFVHYAGIRVGQPLSAGPRTKQVVLREAAVLYGGYVAQQLVTIGGRHDSGKKNDFHRATRLIQNAILRDGLSDEWGKRSIPDNVKTGDYIDQELSPEEKAKLNHITDRWMSYAEQFAREALYVNMDRLFVVLGKRLSEKGFLDQKAISEIHDRFSPVTERTVDFAGKLDEVRKVIALIEQSGANVGSVLENKFRTRAYSVDNAHEAFNLVMKASRKAGLFEKVRTYFFPPWDKLTELQKTVAASYLGNKISDLSRDARIAGEYWMPESVANIDEIIKEERLRETRPVTDLARFEILKQDLMVSEETIEDIQRSVTQKSTAALSCKNIF